ncbi:TIR domain-containing protein [Paenibacillus thailandensis]|uniref:TIR domain-containing protein n=1 Tax=Paenibacillus thailandensis TaxID=393250 RepID=A0ABW5R4M3_9BACL
MDSLGRELSRANPERRVILFSSALKRIKAYHTALEWMFHQNITSPTNVEVAARWYEHNKPEIETDNENTIKDMAVCFFRLCQAAKLGDLIIGRHGQPTRFEVNRESLSRYIAKDSLHIEQANAVSESRMVKTSASYAEGSPASSEQTELAVYDESFKQAAHPMTEMNPALPAKIFISHSKNMEMVEQIKTMLELAELDYEVAVEEETSAIPVPEKVFNAMRRCNAAVICVTADENEKRGNGSYGINQNVLIEIGSAFVLYDKKVILVWDKRLPVPSNLQGLYRCEFSGDELSWSTGMKLMKALSNFRHKTAN